MLVSTDIEGLRALGASLRGIADDLADAVSTLDGRVLPPAGDGWTAPSACREVAAGWAGVLSSAATHLELTGVNIVTAADRYAEADERAARWYRAGVGNLAP